MAENTTRKLSSVGGIVNELFLAMDKFKIRKDYPDLNFAATRISSEGLELVMQINGINDVKTPFEIKLRGGQERRVYNALFAIDSTLAHFSGIKTQEDPEILYEIGRTLGWLSPESPHPSTATGITAFTQYRSEQLY